jgi:hypothetical protein
MFRISSSERSASGLLILISAYSPLRLSRPAMFASDLVLPDSDDFPLRAHVGGVVG